MKSRGMVAVTAVAVALVAVLVSGGAALARNNQPNDSGPAVQHDLSAPLTQLAIGVTPEPDKKEKNEKKKAGRLPIQGGSTSAPDPALQASPGTAAAPAAGLNFEGIGQGFTGPSGAFSVNSAPPDPNGAVGPNHYVQIVNSDYAIFNKAGTPSTGRCRRTRCGAASAAAASRTMTATRRSPTTAPQTAGSSSSSRSRRRRTSTASPSRR